MSEDGNTLWIQPQTAQADVLQDLAEVEDTTETCKQAQTNSGKASENVKALLRYKKLEKPG